MKKHCVILGLALLCGCTQLDKYMTVDKNASAQDKFRACALNEAQIKLQNGTLFAASLSATKDEIVNTCLKKMALEAAGIDSEAQDIASGILAGLMKSK